MPKWDGPEPAGNGVAARGDPFVNGASREYSKLNGRGGLDSGMQISSMHLLLRMMIMPYTKIVSTPYEPVVI